MSSALIRISSILGGQAFGAAGGMAGSSVASAAGSILKRHGALAESAHIDPFTIGALVAGVGVGILNTVNFIVGEDLAEEKAKITGGEVVPKPIFRPKPMPYIPEWRGPMNTKVGLIGYLHMIVVGVWLSPQLTFCIVHRGEIEPTSSLRSKVCMPMAPSTFATYTMLSLNMPSRAEEHKMANSGCLSLTIGKYVSSCWIEAEIRPRAFMQDHHIDFDTETVLRDSFIRASVATTVNYRKFAWIQAFMRFGMILLVHSITQNWKCRLTEP